MKFTAPFYVAITNRYIVQLTSAIDIIGTDGL
jgi:hypothetical protein